MPPLTLCLWSWSFKVVPPDFTRWVYTVLLTWCRLRGKENGMRVRLTTLMEEDQDGSQGVIYARWNQTRSFDVNTFVPPAPQRSQLATTRTLIVSPVSRRLVTIEGGENLQGRRGWRYIRGVNHVAVLSFQLRLWPLHLVRNPTRTMLGCGFTDPQSSEYRYPMGTPPLYGTLR